MEYLQGGKALGYFKNDETHQELKLPSGNPCDVAIFERSSLMNDRVQPKEGKLYEDTRQEELSLE